MPRRGHRDIADDDGMLHDLLDIANIAEPGDNCAIAVRTLEQGTRFRIAGQEATYKLSHTVLEGHRFAIEQIKPGVALTSWKLPFGVATSTLNTGDYIMNSLMRNALQGRRDVTWELPSTVNFKDTDTSLDAAVELNESTFKSGTAVGSTYKGVAKTWMGYSRPAGRGVGTRNMIAVFGVTVNSSRFARAVVAEIRKRHPTGLQQFANVDGICCVAHNEGGGNVLHNSTFLTRVMGGFLTHANIGGALLVTHPDDDKKVSFEAVLNEAGPSLSSLPHHVIHQTASWEDDLQRCVTLILDSLLPEADKTPRTSQPLSAIKVALQCGGSDAFSGITGNPLVGSVSHMVVTAGGSAVLAETPELVGAEPYILDNCKDMQVAQKFLDLTKTYMDYAGRHGQDAAGNPSGGNLYRGLYNIVLKSLGASRKKPPQVTLDGCLQYGEKIADKEHGYYFMDSPGNDLESIAGQVSSGSNVIFFVTGNGAITNFPFVPTLKFVTTSGRFSILSKDMDVNAGVLNERETMEEVSEQTLDKMLNIASGAKSKGEEAGHSQVHIWRDWAVNVGSHVSAISTESANFAQEELKSAPLACRPLSAPLDLQWVRTTNLKEINLVLPTSLCSGQIAKLACDRLNEADPAKPFKNLVHTEGCGGGGGQQLENIMARVLTGHMRSPYVRKAFVLEHGCEKTHNDWFMTQLEATREKGDRNVEAGWGSVQLDGGIDAVCAKIKAHFEKVGSVDGEKVPLRVGFMSKGVSEEDGALCGAVAQAVVGCGGSVVVMANSELLGNAGFTLAALQDTDKGSVRPTLAFAERVRREGFHVMETQDIMSSTELLTGMASAGLSCILWVSSAPCPAPVSHPFIPTLLLSPNGDLPLTAATPELCVKVVLGVVKDSISGRYQTRGEQTDSCDFSIPRGATAISL
eukprot:TRINITY_DN7749_c0_g1_i1.p1 TRINITY_DN7749_c0_g1~~TRINITY_DN7749_c0_g1_i1.p1  ORF type:complete len:939 (+),score=252.25 TRINITY_DN7749_c0_g1_i1:70-2817(+)